MRQFVLFILIFLSIGIKAQKYNDNNVHYYLPVGYSVEDVNKTSFQSGLLYVTIIIERGNSIYSATTGNLISAIARNREKYITSIERTLRNASLRGSYNSKLSTSKYEVYSKNIPSSMFGSGFTSHDAISKDYKELIHWDDKYGADKRMRYYEIDIETLLPKSAESYDFLE